MLAFYKKMIKYVKEYNIKKINIKTITITGTLILYLHFENIKWLI